MRLHRLTSKSLLITSLAALWLGAFSGCEERAATASAPAVESVRRQPAEMEKFFVEWLKAHRETSVVADDRGVGIEGNPLRLRAAVYEVNKVPQRGFSVELEFRIALPAGGEIVEYLAGTGETEEQAMKDCLANFVLTTFHPIYKAFINAGDAHQFVHKVSMDGREREMIRGDFYKRGEKSDDEEGFETMADRIGELLSRLNLDAGPHWIKVVYGQQQGKPTITSVTLDNAEDAELTAKVTALPWPAREQFYLAKQFIVIK